MFRFAYLSIVLSLSLVLIAGFLAFHDERLNQDKTQARALAHFLDGIMAETRRSYAQSKDFSALGAGVAYSFYYAKAERAIKLTPTEQGFALRLTRVPDKFCQALLEHFTSARIKVFESEAHVLNWRAQSGQDLL